MILEDPTVTTREEVIRQLKEAKKLDTECAHGIADVILCELLELLGYGDVVAAYDEIDKWYA